MSQEPDKSRSSVPLDIQENIDRLCDRFESASKAGEQPRLETFLGQWEGAHRDVLFGELLRVELEILRESGGTPIHEEYRDRFGEFADVVDEVFGNAVSRETAPHQFTPVGRGLHIRCPHCHNPVEIVADAELTDIICSSCGSSFSLVKEDQSTRTASTVTKLGRFELIERLGIGGFGSVWKARDIELDRAVAVKIPRKGQLEPDEVEKFLREARAAAQLRHPNIVGVHEVGREGDTVYIVSDLVRGVPLSEWMEGYQLTSRDAAQLCVKIAEALHHAHEAGIVHRDLKPQNIVMDNNGEPHLMDFGLARREVGEITMTIDGQVLGTPAYMSPEQARGEAHAADRRTDIYSLGVILFRLLTGELPFRGSARMLIHQVINDEPPSPRKLNSNIPRDIQTICLKCLEKSPSKRYDSAKDVVNELHSFLDGHPIQARPVGRLQKGWRWCKRHPGVAFLWGSLAISLVTGALVAILFWSRAESIAAEARDFAAKYKQESRQNRKLAAKEREARDDAEEKGRKLERHLRVANGLRLAAESRTIQTDYPIRSVLLAVEAVEIDYRDDKPILAKAHEALLNTLPTIKGRPLKHEASIYSATISPDGRWLVTRCEDYTTRVWDLTAEDPAASPFVLRGQKGGCQIYDRWLLMHSRDKFCLWNLTDEDPAVSPIVFNGNGVQTVAISPEGRWLVTHGIERNLNRSPSKRHPLGFPRNCRETVQLWDLAADHLDTKRPVFRGAGWCASSTRHRSNWFVVSPDNRWLITQGRYPDSRPRLWDLKSKDLLTPPIVLGEHDYRLYGSPNRFRAAFSPDGRWLVEAGFSIALWNLTAADLAASHFDLKSGENEPFEISPDNRWLVTGSRDKTVRLWDLTDEDPAASPIVLKPCGSVYSSVAISPDSRWVVTKSRDEPARLWDLTVEDPAASAIVLREHDGRLNHLAEFSPDGRWLVTGSRDNDTAARLWDLTVEDPAASPIVLRGHDRSILGAEFSPDGRWLKTLTHTTHTTRLARLWDLTAEDLADSPVIVRDPMYPVSFSSNGRWFVTKTEGTVRLNDLAFKDLAASSLILRHEGYIRSAEISSDSRWLVTGSDNKTACLWDLTAETPAASPLVLPQEDGVYFTHFSSDGRRLVTTSSNNVRVWDLTAETPSESPLVLNVPGNGYRISLVSIDVEGRWLVTVKSLGSYNSDTARLWNLTAHEPATSARVLQVNTGDIASIAISPDSRWIAAATGSVFTDIEPAVWLWDLTLQNPAESPLVLRGHASIVHSVTFSSDRHWLVTASYDGTARVWDLTAEDPAASPLVLRGHEGAIYSVAISPDNRWLVTGSRDKTVRLWDLTDEDPAASPIVLKPCGSLISSVAISPNSRWVVARSDTTAYVWDLTDEDHGSPIALRGHEYAIRSVGISPDSCWLVTASPNTARLWDLNANNVATSSRVLCGHNSSINRVAISPDSHWLVTTSFDTAYLWNLDVDSLLDRARRIAGRDLTSEERDLYLLDAQ